MFYVGETLKNLAENMSVIHNSDKFMTALKIYGSKQSCY